MDSLLDPLNLYSNYIRIYHFDLIRDFLQPIVYSLAGNPNVEGHHTQHSLGTRWSGHFQGEDGEREGWMGDQKEYERTDQEQQEKDRPEAKGGASGRGGIYVNVTPIDQIFGSPPFDIHLKKLTGGEREWQMTKKDVIWLFEHWERQRIDRNTLNFYFYLGKKL